MYIASSQTLRNNCRHKSVHTHTFLLGSSDEPGVESLRHACDEAATSGFTGLRRLSTGFSMRCHPTNECVLPVRDGLLGCLAVRHAARQIRKGDEKPTAFACRQRTDLERVVVKIWRGHGSTPNVVYQGQELLHINRFDRAVRRNAHFQYRCLVLEHDMAPWRFPHHDPKTNRNGFKSFDPPTARIIAHSLQGLVGLRHRDNDTAYSITPSLVGCTTPGAPFSTTCAATSSAWGIGSSSSSPSSPS